MSQMIKCPSCGKTTEIPAFPGNVVYYVCGCPIGHELAKGWKGLHDKKHNR